MGTRAWPGGLMLAAAALCYAALLAGVRRADRAYPSRDPSESTWWFGYARDAVNLSGAALFGLGFVLVGLPAPLAFLAGCLFGLLTYALDFVFARRVRAGRPAIVLASVAVPLALLAAVCHEPLEAGLTRLIDYLFSAPFLRLAR